MMKRINISFLIVCLCTLLVPSRAPAQPEPPEAAGREEDPRTVIRTYNVSDLMRAARDYPLDSDIVPPTGYGASGGGATAAAGAFGGIVQPGMPGKPADANVLESLSQIILNLVDSESWQDNGGTIGQIQPFGTLLVITQTEENHKQIQSLFDEIRRNAGPSQIVAVRATWLLLDAGGSPQPGSVVDEAWFDKQPVYCDGRTVCFSGQTVHITSGRGRTIVTDTTPIVGTQAVAFDPEVSQVQSGVSVQVAPQLVPGAESAILDLHSFASEWDQPEPPVRAAGGATATTQPAGNVMTETAVDRINVVAQAMKTTLRVPLGQKFVIGGMTMDPAAGDEDARGAKQICLIVEVTAVK